MKKLFFIGFLAVIFIACSSPERDGRRASQNFCDCADEFEKNLDRTMQYIFNNFVRQNFVTRVEARQWSDELMTQIMRTLADCNYKAEYNYFRLKERYIGNREQTAKFEYAFRANMEFASRETVSNIDWCKIASLISTIIPPKPNLEKIKRDLVGRRITPQLDSYFRRDRFWEIQNDDIRDIQIMNESRRGNDYWFQVRLVFQQDAGAFEAFVNLTYVLPRYADDWEISFQENISVNFVRTGQFCNCVTVERRGRSGEFYLRFTNHCDVTLVVGGSLILQWGNEWRIFATQVEPFGTSTIGGLFLGSVGDYKIHFIERP